VMCCASNDASARVCRGGKCASSSTGSTRCAPERCRCDGGGGGGGKARVRWRGGAGWRRKRSGEGNKGVRRRGSPPRRRRWWYAVRGRYATAMWASSVWRSRRFCSRCKRRRRRRRRRGWGRGRSGARRRRHRGWKKRLRRWLAALLPRVVAAAATTAHGG
jgi:hypothetical protein